MLAEAEKVAFKPPAQAIGGGNQSIWRERRENKIGYQKWRRSWHRHGNLFGCVNVSAKSSSKRQSQCGAFIVVNQYRNIDIFNKIKSPSLKWRAKKKKTSMTSSVESIVRLLSVLRALRLCA